MVAYILTNNWRIKCFILTIGLRVELQSWTENIPIFMHLHGLYILHVKTVVVCLFHFYVTTGLPFKGIIILRIFACGRLYLMIVFFFQCGLLLQKKENINIIVTWLFLIATDKKDPRLIRVEILSYVPNSFFKSVVLRLFLWLAASAISETC